MKSQEILPKDKRLNKSQLLALETHGGNYFNKLSVSQSGSIPTLAEYHKALEAAEEAEALLKKQLQLIENQALMLVESGLIGGFKSKELKALLETIDEISQGKLFG